MGGTFPDVTFFSQLSSKFDFKDFYVYDKREDWLQLEGGIGNKIIENFDLMKQKSPWFYYIHLMDLHSPFKLPSHYNSSNFGKTQYDRMITCIDSWLGKFLEKINLSDTIVVLSADHGDYIPVVDALVNPSKKVQKILRKGKQIAPKLEPVGIKLVTKTKSFLENKKLQKLKNELSEKELRTLGTRGTSSLFDELLIIPFIISGTNIPHSKNINNMVRQVDIFPTLLHFANIPSELKKIDGQNLSPIFNQNNLEELPAYIETGSRNPKDPGKLIGIRTSKYKFLRSRKSKQENLMLFDLDKDPYEEENIATNQTLICNQMERILSTFIENAYEIPEIPKENEKTVEEELKKLGYL